MARRGYCGIGIYGTKNAANVGTLWRSAGVMGAAFIFTVGRRFPRQTADTIKAWKHIPYFEVAALDDLPIPKDCLLVGVEQSNHAKSLPTYKHPERAVYLLGAEDKGLPPSILAACNHVVEIPSDRCLNVASAGSIVLYDRNAKAAMRG